ncbi:hypothetical protein ABT136_23190, partial [Streptomyces sp. NPDC001856]
MDISGTRLRAVRAALFTAFVVTLSTASHVLLSRAPLPLNTVAESDPEVAHVEHGCVGGSALVRPMRRRVRAG